MKEKDRLRTERELLKAKVDESGKEKDRLQNFREVLTGENRALRAAKEQVIEERDRLRVGMDAPEDAPPS